MRQQETKPTNRKGSTLVEFSILLAFIVMFVGGTVEISRVLMFQNAADTAAYEGARSAMVPGATAEEARLAAIELLEAAGLYTSSVTVTPAIITEDTGFITVEVALPVAANSWVTPSQMTDFTVTSEVTLVCERPPLIRLTALPSIKAKKNKGSKAGL